MNLQHPGIVGLLGAVLATLALTAPAADLAETLARYQVQESATPARTNPLWRKPRKVLLLQYGVRASELDAFRAAIPDVNFVVASDPRSAASAATDADVIIGSNPEVCDARVIGNAQQLRWLASLSAGVENCMNLPAVKARSLMLTNMRGVDSPVIAEHAIALMLALAHGLDRFAVDTSRGIWSRGSANGLPLQYLEGKTMLVSGLGGIGTEVAKRAHGLGMKVVATRVGGSGKPDFVSYVGQPDELLKLARTADVIVSAVPLTPATTGMYNKEFFAVLKPTAYFINVARGGSVVTEALAMSLSEGRLAGAGLDVVDPEPLPPGHMLWKAPRVLMTPHIAGWSDLPEEARWTITIENLRRYVAGGKMFNVVDLTQGF